MKTVKAKDVAKGKWRIKPGDRLNLTSLENNKSVSEHLGKLAEVMQLNIKVLDKMGSVIEKTNKSEARLPTPSPVTPNVEVIVPPPKEVKKRYRVTPVRDNDGRIDYVDIEQL